LENIENFMLANLEQPRFEMSRMIKIAACAVLLAREATDGKTNLFGWTRNVALNAEKGSLWK
jgi:hypothetical protein